MKHLLIAITVMGMIAGSSLQAQEQTSPASETEKATLAMYYFHTSFRCTTCRTVEEQSKMAFESLYPEQFKEGSATFQAVNLDEEDNAALVEKYHIAGQTLLIDKNGNTADLTSQGFLYAKTNPEKLKEEIRKAVDNL